MNDTAAEKFPPHIPDVALAHPSDELERQIRTVTELLASVASIQEENRDNQIYSMKEAYWNRQYDVVLDALEKKEITREQAKNIFKTHQAESEMKAETDNLTLVYNRQGFSRRIVEVMSHATRSLEPVSIAVLDIDFFKKFNDLYGHDVGDAVLHQVAAFLKENSRTSDIIGRIGGEEFALLMPATSEDGAITHLEKLRETITGIVGEALIGMGYTINIPITISVGSAQREPSGPHDPLKKDEIDMLVKSADDRLYLAKKTGRNKVVSSINEDAVKDYLANNPPPEETR